MSQTYLITGASRGLGLEFVKQLSAQGHTVIATARQPGQSEALSSLVDNKKVFTVPLDTTNKDSIKSAFEKIKTISDGVDVLINNSGIAGPREFDVLNVPGETYTEVFNTNVIGTSDVTQAAIPLLRQKNTRKIINISSIVGSVQLNICGGGIPAYGVSKAAENYLTKAFSSALKDENFIVVAVHPGWVKTDMGGSSASITTDVSIAGIINEINKLTKEKNGTYFDYSGKTLPF
ncbi:4-dihydrotrisporin dehydrogenase [Halteromyces radiatus]|uniref:4-dihydrotrisporin dehydrogenase n=1 Tax=Halteromyces radiatus TaxID=101107 RepID=UPI002220DB43|nr:4-dihydrotrisporin dehydrogenase [Halteromyces radiatus]KAI8097057.1 4-dihydrotrisporin dehydrogenase [Halteromyces radiatus]